MLYALDRSVGLGSWRRRDGKRMESMELEDGKMGPDNFRSLLGSRMQVWNCYQEPVIGWRRNHLAKLGVPGIEVPLLIR